MRAASPIALDACVTTPSSEVDHRIGGGGAASCPLRSGGNIRDPPPGVRRPPSLRTVPAVQARKESRPLALDKDGSQQLEPPKAKPRGPSEPSGTRDPSAPACAPIMQSNTVSVCDLMWRALAAGHHFGKNVKPRPYMNLRDSQHLTTHCQQLRAYRQPSNMPPHPLPSSQAPIRGLSDHRVCPRATVILLTPELAGVPERRRMWHSRAGGS